MTKRTRLLTAAGATLLLLLVAAIAFILGGGRGAAAATSPVSPAGDMTAAGAPGLTCGDFQQKLAANLGVGEDRLRAAVKQSALQEADEALGTGRITADQAQRLRDRINQSNGNLPCFHLERGKPGPHGRLSLVLPAMADAAAQYFNISRDQLLQDLKDTGSLQGVAARYGQDTPDGKNGLEQAMEAALRQALTDRGIDAARVDQLANEFKQHFDRLYTRNWKQFGPGAGPGGWFGGSFVIPGDGQFGAPAGGPFGGPRHRAAPARPATPTQ